MEYHVCNVPFKEKKQKQVPVQVINALVFLSCRHFIEVFSEHTLLVAVPVFLTLILKLTITPILMFEIASFYSS